MNTLNLLEKLISFDTTSHRSNMALMDFIGDQLRDVGVDSTLIPNKDGTKANLFATIGPKDKPGVMLSGHTDVVPVDGQNWTKPPFELTSHADRFFGRGTTDMKGFIASALAAGIRAAKHPLRTPLHLAFSYDEEIGCQGVRSMIDMLSEMPIKPAICIVGEPTSMIPATGHKGKIALRATCVGQEGHSALAPFALNAIHLATDLISALRRTQADLHQTGAQDGDYDVPYTTIHVGRITGGAALNIVPNHCEVLFEIRNLAQDNPQDILDKIKTQANRIVNEHKDTFPIAEIRFEPIFSYPGLNTSQNHDVVEFVKSLTGSNSTKKVAFGTEGGLFDGQVGIPTVVCGPGSMDQGHKPDEYIEASQLNRCDAMMENLLDRLCAGVSF